LSVDSPGLGPEDWATAISLVSGEAAPPSS